MYVYSEIELKCVHPIPLAVLQLSSIIENIMNGMLYLVNTPVPFYIRNSFRNSQKPFKTLLIDIFMTEGSGEDFKGTTLIRTNEQSTLGTRLS